MKLRLSLSTLNLLASIKQCPFARRDRTLDFPFLTYDHTELEPGHIHFGFGSFVAANIALQTHLVLQSGGEDAKKALAYGIVGVNIQPPVERGDEINPQDGLYTVLAQDSAGKKTLTVVGSVIGFMYGPDDPNKVVDRIASPATRLISMTIMPQTHQAYIDGLGCLKQDRDDIQNDLDQRNPPQTVYGYIARGLQKRREDLPGITVLNFDNMEKNGSVFKETFLQFTEAYDKKNGTSLTRLAEEKLSFPNSMVDRIVPKPTEKNRRIASQKLGLEDMASIATEPMPDYPLIIDNAFLNGKPAWDRAGKVLFVDDVTPYELMKLRLINGTFFAISQLAHLKGIKFVHEAITDPAIRDFAIELMKKESLPTLEPVPSVDLNAYMEEVVKRLSNPALQDTVERIVNDGGPTKTVQAALAQCQNGIPTELRALCVAAWIRRAQVDQDESGNKLEFKHPLETVLKQKARNVLGDPADLFRMKEVFGDLGAYPQFVATVVKYLSLLNQPNGVNKTIEAALEAANQENNNALQEAQRRLKAGASSLKVTRRAPQG